MSPFLRTSRALLPAVVLALCLPGCGGSRADGDGAPPGVIAMWGMPGCIDGTFVKPRVIDCLPGGDVFIIDRSGRVQFFDAAGGFVSKFVLKNTEKGYPTGSAVTPDGRVWIAETHAYRVAVYSRDGGEIFSFGSRGAGDGEFTYPTDVAVSPAGAVYVSDFGDCDRVEEFDAEGRFVRSHGTTGTAPGEFRRAQALVVAPDGSWFVADSCNDRIQKFSPEGKCLGVFGKAGDGPGELSYPYDMAIGPDGMVYIVEYGNCRVQRMTLEGEFRGTWGSRGSKPGELAQPWSIAVDKDSRLFILDTGNNRVVVLDAALAQWSRAVKGPSNA